MKKTLYLMRHGQTLFNQRKKFKVFAMHHLPISGLTKQKSLVVTLKKTI